MNGEFPCDLVMKGGVASGIVYPTAILKLREKYYFKNIGGTSAGAIAASVTASAQYGINTGKNPESFDYFEKQLKTFFLEDRDNLKNLFQPSEKNEWLFNFALRLMGEDEKLSFIFQHIATILWHSRKIKSAFKNLEENLWGFCTGMRSEADKKKNKTPALTEWLDDIIQKCSGLDKENKPLTFGDLRGENENDKYSINLKMVTSNLSQNQPYVLPFEDKYFIFEKNEFYQLFPRYLVDYMINVLEGKQKESYKEDNKKTYSLELPEIKNDLKGKEYHFLPIGEYMPILVATRMSLSFPFLFSMIPLYTIKTGSKNKTQINHQDLQRNFFSDGGISSNFPIQFFDSLIPSYPTFGFNLSSEEEFTYLPTNIISNAYKIPFPPNQQNQDIYLANPEDLPCPQLNDIDSVGDIILKGIFPTAQNYRDTMQSGLPSYRERIIQILISSGEGGLNLDMDRRKIEDLQQKGEKAGTELLNKFNFKYHQWVRVKMMMGLLEKGLKEIDEITKKSDFNYQELLKLEQEDENNFPYPETDSQWCKESQARIDALIQLINQMKNGDEFEEIFSDTKPLCDEKQILLRVTPEI